MTRVVIRAAALLAACAIATCLGARARAQSADALSGPVVGYLWSPDVARVHPINGIAGSATIGPALTLPFEAELALPIDAAHVLLVTRSAPGLVVFNPSTHDHLAVTPDIDVAPTQAAISNDGTTAALIDAASQRLVVVGGLTSQPALLHTASLASIGTPITHVAVNDSATMVAFTALEGGASSVYAWVPGGEPRFLGASASLDALAITNDDRIVVADARTDAVFLVAKDEGQTQWRLLDGRATGASQPVGLALTTDGRIFVANAGTGTVTTFGSGGRRLGAVACNCTLTGLQRVRGGLYRLSARVDRTVYLFDAQGSIGRVYFVPPRQP